MLVFVDDLLQVLDFLLVLMQVVHVTSRVALLVTNA